nr:hypothetical protein Itr_chr04CG09780 [Ipomoea trifida]
MLTITNPIISNSPPTCDDEEEGDEDPSNSDPPVTSSSPSPLKGIKGHWSNTMNCSTGSCSSDIFPDFLSQNTKKFGIAYPSTPPSYSSSSDYLREWRFLNPSVGEDQQKGARGYG